MLVLVIALPAMAGCIGDAGTPDDELTADQTATEALPERGLPEEITGLTEVTRFTDLAHGKAIWIEDGLLYNAGEGAGLSIVDISDPAEPVVVSQLTEATGRDVDLLTYEDGRKVAVLADSSRGLRFVDVADPQQPEEIATLLGGRDLPDQEGANVHNVAVVPGTHLVYNSRSVDTPGVDVVDASDPAEPERVGVVRPELTCHDVTFHPEGEPIAYCAGVHQTQIWDTSDPEAPEVLGRIVNPSITIHHWAQATQNGNLLMIGDEFLGATGPHAQGCLAGTSDPTGQGTLTPPVGAVWFYDISDPAQPEMLGYVAADQVPSQEDIPPLPCTAHFGDVVPDHDKLVLTFIRGGTYLVDFTDPTAPELIDHHPLEGQTWEARYTRGYALAANQAHGLDVFGFE